MVAADAREFERGSRSELILLFHGDESQLLNLLDVDMDTVPG